MRAGYHLVLFYNRNNRSELVCVAVFMISFAVLYVLHVQISLSILESAQKLYISKVSFNYLGWISTVPSLVHPMAVKPRAVVKWKIVTRINITNDDFLLAVTWTILQDMFNQFYMTTHLWFTITDLFLIIQKYPTQQSSRTR